MYDRVLFYVVFSMIFRYVLFVNEFVLVSSYGAPKVVSTTRQVHTYSTMKHGYEFVQLILDTFFLNFFLSLLKLQMHTTVSPNGR